ncbi:MAG TPA: DNA mismatch repair protein MutS [Aestuariivirgaceae bacterium]|nr:DNA mismatch repair protein MutS [Aestuariivirgaceae bacterium]
MESTGNSGKQETAGEDGARPTPMMAQFLEIKAAHPDHLLFYRMGDFYELFFEDAEVASAALGIALTKRGKHLGRDIAMCGVPVHSADEYLERLIRSGHRVAVCEQMEDPELARRRGGKSVVKRAVTRLVTPGTLTEERLLDARRHNYLAALARVKGDGDLSLAWLDMSTGDFAVTALKPGDLAAEFARLEPGEVIMAEALMGEEPIYRPLKEQGVAMTPLPASRFDSASGERRLKEQFKVAALDAFGGFSRAELAAAGALVDYVALTQVGRLPAISPPRRLERDHAMSIDQATRANLELVRTLSGERTGSLAEAIDSTVTGPGGRLFMEWLNGPLSRAGEINRRLDAVGFLLDDATLRGQLRQSLKQAPDLGRALSRLTVGRGSPRDLGAIAAGLAAALALARHLASARLGLPRELDDVAKVLGAEDGTLQSALTAALDDDLPAFARDGGFVRPDYLVKLDEERRLRDDSKRVIAGLQATYAEATGIKALKVRHNNVIGYFVEVAQQHGGTLLAPPHDALFRHRQTMANVMRFSTPELGELESRLSMAASRAVALELEIFADLVERVGAEAQGLLDKAHALAKLDVFAALAELAARQRYVRPNVDESLSFEIVAGRHPVVEMALARTGEQAFVPNDCDLSAGDSRSIWLVTGPNMAGKSTFLRQNALIAIMAQMGSFVPADSAHIGIVDRLFSRVGAADDLARGRSTFMVEMVETAAILNQAGPRALVILDEIGRGTATFDGLSIAWASVEHLHEVNCCRALFATHFHELTALASRLGRLANVTMKVREWQGEVIFLHEVGPGSADRSYGIQVAKLAGLPASVVARAAQVLEVLERSEQASARRDLVDDLPLFAATRPASARRADAGPSAVEVMVDDLAPDELTPREALDFVYRLKAARMEEG